MDVATMQFSAMWMPPAQRDPVTAREVTQPLKPAPETPPTNKDEAEQARSLVTTVARAAVEALTGYRPMNQLARWMAPAAIGGLAMAKRHGSWTEAKIKRVWASRRTTNAIEGVAQVMSRDHQLAITIGLERTDGHWICTHLSVLLPGSHLSNR